jgi:hypothetical protein
MSTFFTDDYWRLIHVHMYMYCSSLFYSIAFWSWI